MIRNQSIAAAVARSDNPVTMPFLIGPESARARWTKTLPADVTAGLAVVGPVAAASRVLSWRVDGADFLVLGGDDPARALDDRSGVVVSRVPGGAIPPGTKWKARPGTILAVRAPVALFSTANLGEPTPLALALGSYEIALAPDLVRLKFIPGSEPKKPVKRKPSKKKATKKPGAKTKKKTKR
jgi:hypothetical protein